jgi:hypothetical protein
MRNATLGVSDVIFNFFFVTKLSFLLPFRFVFDATFFPSAAAAAPHQRISSLATAAPSTSQLGAPKSNVSSPSFVERHCFSQDASGLDQMDPESEW